MANHSLQNEIKKAISIFYLDVFYSSDTLNANLIKPLQQF